MNEKSQIAIIGAGLMGHGIAQVFAVAGHLVTVFDPSTDALASLRDRVGRNLTDLGLSPAAAERIFPVESVADAVKGADVVFEAGPESLAFKQQLFGELEVLCAAHTLLASNT